MKWQRGHRSAFVEDRRGRGGGRLSLGGIVIALILYAIFGRDVTGLLSSGELAGGGGQQGPLLAAAGAVVTVVDASEGQLGQDRKVAEREGLTLTTVQADMADLSAFETASFDLVFHPVSNLFVADVRPVWREAARVLRRGGELLAGFVNPLYFLFDDDALGRGELVVRYRIPYADPEQLDSASLDALMAQNEPLCFGHSLTDQIGGQLDAGLAMIGLYEDRWEDKAIDDLIATFVATRSRKL